MRSQNNGFKDFVLDQLADWPGVTCRAMFGGYGLYHERTFFGIIHKGRLYFKTDPSTALYYRTLNMKPFRPNASQTLKNYYEVPADILEDADRLIEYARQASRARSR